MCDRWQYNSSLAPLSQRLAFPDLALNGGSNLKRLSRIGRPSVEGTRLMFQWNCDQLSKVAEVIEQYTPAEEIPFARAPDPDVTHGEPPDGTKPGWWRRHDVIAWYVPAHNREAERYGIHFDAPKVARMALDLKELAVSHGQITDREWIIAAIEICFWHEVAHGWIEDLVTLAETMTNREYYVRTNTGLHPCYIREEEQACNTSATGMMKVFFQCHRDKSAIFDAMLTYMKKQPPGYCDCDNLCWYSCDDPSMHEMIWCVLTAIYLIPPKAALHAARVFFDFFAHPHLHSRADAPLAGTSLYRSACAYPLFIEPPLDTSNSTNE